MVKTRSFRLKNCLSIVECAIFSLELDREYQRACRSVEAGAAVAA